MKVDMWTDRGKTGIEVTKRYKAAMDHRRLFERTWASNEALIYPSDSGMLRGAILPLPNNTAKFLESGIGDEAPRMRVPYSFKNLRFLHAQLSANPPTVIAKPQTSDQADYHKASAGDKLCRYLHKQYKLQEKVDQVSLYTLLYGSGVAKTVFDPYCGDLLERDMESGILKLEGDIKISNPDIRNIGIDPDATTQDEIKWVTEDIYLDLDEAISRWPDKAEVLREAKLLESDATYMSYSVEDERDRSTYFNIIHLVEYWEVGLASNAYLGRYALTTPAGAEIVECRPSPFRFRQRGAAPKLSKLGEREFRERFPQYEGVPLADAVENKLSKLPEVARLPYHFLTDIDVPGSVWGRSAVEYAAPLEELLNKIDSAHLANIRAHGSTKIVTAKNSNITHLTDDQLDVIETDIPGGISHLQPPGVMPEMVLTRKNIIDAIDQVFGVNEAMFGQQSREQAAVTMQYATNQGNMIRRRVFNKYVMFVESVYQALLDLVIKHWTISKLIQVNGNEKSLDAVELKGSDVDGGFDIHVDYGISFSLDPQTRYQQVLLSQPLFEKAGIKPRQLLRYLKLSELESLHDATQLAENRMREIFLRIITSNQQVQPKRLMDFEKMMEYALDYFMTDEFNRLPEELQEICKQHYELMGQLVASEQTGLAPGGSAAGGTAINPEQLQALPGAQPQAALPGESLGTAPILNQ